MRSQTLEEGEGERMIIMGHPWVESRRFRQVRSPEEIAQSRADEIVLLAPLAESAETAQYCRENDIPYAVRVESVKDALFANAMHAAFLICSEEVARQVQPVAETYLFDAKVLVPIDGEEAIAEMARAGIDGVLFEDAVL